MTEVSEVPEVPEVSEVSEVAAQESETPAGMDNQASEEHTAEIEAHNEYLAAPSTTAGPSSHHSDTLDPQDTLLTVDIEHNEVQSNYTTDAVDTSDDVNPEPTTNNEKRKHSQLPEEQHLEPQSDTRPNKRSKRDANQTNGQIDKSPTIRKKSARTKPLLSKPKMTQPKHRSTDLTHRSMVEDIAAAQGKAQQPSFSTDNNREKALKDLMGHVPESKKPKARKDAAWFNEACRGFTGRSLKPKNGAWGLEGMKTSLRNHQVISAGFMRHREISDQLPKSGILGDQMGLGKTIVALACTVNGKPRMQRGWKRDPDGKDENMPQTTLVVVPSSLLQQWFDEMSLHCERVSKRKKWGIGSIKVFRHSDSSTTRLKDLYDADIVLTTPDDVRKSMPKFVYPKGMPTGDKAAYFEENFPKTLGLLQQATFHRIIYDEGHVIRNHDIQLSQATYHLKANHRWILSGTPLVNGGADVYSYAYFIRHPLVYPDMKLKDWKKLYGPQRNDKQPTPLPNTLMECFHRFTYSDDLFGACIVTLPPMHHFISEIEFLPFEKVINRIIDRRLKFITRSNKDGEELSGSMNFLALLTMKRQLSSHPLILPTKICDIVEFTDFGDLDDGLKEQEQRGHKGNSYIHRLHEQLQARHSSDHALEDSTTQDLTESWFSKSLDVDEVCELSDQHQRKGKGKEVKTGRPHRKGIENNSFLALFSKTASLQIHNQRTQCASCGRPADQARKALPCNHVYCMTHLKDMMHEQQSANPVCKSPACGKVIQSNRSADTADASFPKWQNEDGEVFHSAKTLAIKSQILKFWEEDPTAKIIVFTVWIDMLEILSKIFHSEGWVHTRLQGGLSEKVRGDNIANFKSDPKVKILIATLNTGGVGLNLTCASKAILCEPWWHSGAEDQAFGRLYRIGQDKETTLTKIVVKNSIDEMLMHIQEKKDIDINQVLSDKKGHQMQQLQRFAAEWLEDREIS
ncbi:hypothetical protein D6D04_10426 [Aureobasidium pullulans]|nr:hypothetical protein D6D04_10426 [Aureobasidium pullulans]